MEMNCQVQHSIWKLYVMHLLLSQVFWWLFMCRKMDKCCWELTYKKLKSCLTYCSSLLFLSHLVNGFNLWKVTRLGLCRGCWACGFPGFFLNKGLCSLCRLEGKELEVHQHVNTSPLFSRSLMERTRVCVNYVGLKIVILAGFLTAFAKLWQKLALSKSQPDTTPLPCIWALCSLLALSSMKIAAVNWVCQWCSRLGNGDWNRT